MDEDTILGILVIVGGSLASCILVPVIQNVLTEISRDYICGKISNKPGFLAHLELEQKDRRLLVKDAGNAIISSMQNIRKKYDQKRRFARRILTNYISDAAFLENLCKPLEVVGCTIDHSILSERWRMIGAEPVSSNSFWQEVAADYQRKTEKFQRNNEYLYKKMRDTRADAAAAAVLLPPSSDLKGYRDAIRPKKPSGHLEFLLFQPQLFRQLPTSGSHLDNPEIDLQTFPDAFKLARLPATEKKPRLLLILGSSGSGKTTLLRQIEREWWKLPGDPGTATNEPTPTTKDYASATKAAPLPLFVDLKELAEFWDKTGHRTILNFFHESNFVSNLNQHDLDKLLKEGRAAFLLDGLDKVPNSSREEISAAISKLATEYKEITIRVTSRENESILTDENSFRTIELEPFDENQHEQISKFLRAWEQHASSSNTAGWKEKQDALRKAILDSPAVLQLASHPAYLRLIVKSYEKGQKLPHTRAQLFKQVAEPLLKEWCDKKTFDREGLHLITRETKEKILSQLALRVFNDKPETLRTNCISSEVLRKRLTEILKEMEQDNGANICRVIMDQSRECDHIIRSAGGDDDDFQFSNPSLFSYFIALASNQKVEGEKLGESLQQVFSDHWEDPWCSEMLCILAGLPDNTDILALSVKWMLDQPEFTCIENTHKKFDNMIFIIEIIREIRHRHLDAFALDWKSLSDRMIARARAVNSDRDLFSIELSNIVKFFPEKLDSVLFDFIRDFDLNKNAHAEVVAALARKHKNENEMRRQLSGFARDNSLPAGVRIRAISMLTFLLGEGEDIAFQKNIAFHLLIDIIHEQPGSFSDIREYASDCFYLEFRDDESAFIEFAKLAQDPNLPPRVRLNGIDGLLLGGYSTERRDDAFQGLYMSIRQSSSSDELADLLNKFITTSILDERLFERLADYIQTKATNNSELPTDLHLVILYAVGTSRIAFGGWIEAEKATQKYPYYEFREYHKLLLSRYPSVFRLLIEVCKSNLPGGTCEEALQVLITHFGMQEETYGLLAGFIPSPGLPKEIRQVVLERFIEHFGGQEETYPLLAGSISNCDLPSVTREVALRGMIKHFGSREGTYRLMVEFIRSSGLPSWSYEMTFKYLRGSGCGRVERLELLAKFARDTNLSEKIRSQATENLLEIISEHTMFLDFIFRHSLITSTRHSQAAPMRPRLRPPPSPRPLTPTPFAQAGPATQRPLAVSPDRSKVHDKIPLFDFQRHNKPKTPNVYTIDLKELEATADLFAQFARDSALSFGVRYKSAYNLGRCLAGQKKSFDSLKGCVIDPNLPDGIRLVAAASLWKAAAEAGQWSKEGEEVAIKKESESLLLEFAKEVTHDQLAWGEAEVLWRFALSFYDHTEDAAGLDNALTCARRADELAHNNYNDLCSLGSGTEENLATASHISRECFFTLAALLCKTGKKDEVYELIKMNRDNDEDVQRLMDILKKHELSSPPEPPSYAVRSSPPTRHQPFRIP